MYFKTILGGIFMAVNLQAIQLNLSVDKIDTTKGGDIAVYISGEDGFPKDHSKAYIKQIQRAVFERLTFEFELPDSLKEIAIKVHHDENSDTKVTKNWTGIYPKEGLGFSNKQTLGMFGPPSYKNSKISLQDIDSEIQISVKYP